MTRARTIGWTLASATGALALTIACGDDATETSIDTTTGDATADATADVTTKIDATTAIDGSTADVVTTTDANADVTIPKDSGTCATTTCGTNAVCSQDGGAPLCSCKPGFAGDGGTCADINECASAPCQNGGACVDGVASYTCNCVAGYSGPNCETNIDDCAANPCQNGGTCNDGVATYTCSCALGYSGDNCQTNIDDCAANPCQNGGACSDLVNDYSCACPGGYDGKNCENNINECAPAPCQNGAACTDLINDYSCACPAGYSGKNCETNIDECSPNPCQNGGSCTDGIASYTCACVGPYVGPTCSLLKPAAISFLNLNEGTGTTTADNSGNGHTGTLVNSPTWTSGKNGFGLQFSTGSNYVQTGGLTSLATNNTPFTFAFWMKANTNTGVLAHVSSGAAGNGWCTPYIGFDASGNLLAQAFYDVTPSTYYTVKVSSPLATGVWTHVAVTWSAANGLRLFVNGSLISTDARFNYNGAGGSNILWGSKNNQGCWAGSIVGNGFDGTLDEMGYYSAELTLDQIQALMY